MTEANSTSERIDADDAGCSLTETEAQRRRERVTDKLFPFLEAVERPDDGVTFEFEDTEEAVENVMEFVRLEHQCCSFAVFDLELRSDDEPARLTISGEGSTEMYEKGIKPLLAEYDAELVV